MCFGMRVKSIMISVLLLVTGIFLPLNTASTASAAASGFSTSGVSLPSSSIQTGTSFVVKGTVKSNVKIKYLYVGAVSSSGKWVKNAYAVAKPKAKSYNISKLDSKIAFGKIPAGKYYYRIWVKDYNGTKRTVVNKYFSVKSLKASGVSKPSNTYKGKSFTVKGKISSKYKITYVKAGITNSSKKWVSGKYVTVKPNAKSYNLNRLDSRIAVSRLSAGTYYYYVRAKDTRSKTTTLVKKKFTVSQFSLKSYKYPTTLSVGKGFSVVGTVKSAHTLNYVRAGIKTSSGKWIKGKYANKNPRKTSYDLSGLDSKIKFGALSAGTYYYSVWCRDVNGVSKTLLKKKFKVGSTNTNTSTGDVVSGGRTLSYKSSLITSTIGPQPYSGPCGLYAMAYCRAVIDGYFTKNGYSSIESRIIHQYGHGTSLAYWGTAGGDPCYYTTARSCYKVALKQVVNGKPAIINVYNGYTGNQHYVAVIGYVAGTTYDNVSLSKFIVLDPAYGAKKYLSTMKYYNNSSPQCITF